ncbi:hypothetical protein F4819DRAFT_446390 [Hypoxylon fuscum]|nr:hypothetical protein F4819DRAFT_446390 [Hypoxylon fuscum]
MPSFSSSTIFHKRSKSSLSSRKTSLEENSALQHSRKWSTSSTLSQSSTASSHDKLCDPLSLHPPLNLNTAPNIIPEYDVARYHEDAERENRFFNQTHHAENHTQASAEYSSVKGRNCYIVQPQGGRPYCYNQSVQWPLKDWQAVPPGLAELDSSATSSPTESPTRPTNHQRRPTEWMNDRDALLKRGDWKRRGIIFQLPPEEEEEQEQHFELPE